MQETCQPSIIKFTKWYLRRSRLNEKVNAHRTDNTVSQKRILSLRDRSAKNKIKSLALPGILTSLEQQSSTHYTILRKVYVLIEALIAFQINDLESMVYSTVARESNAIFTPIIMDLPSFGVSGVVVYLRSTQTANLFNKNNSL